MTESNRIVDKEKHSNRVTRTERNREKAKKIFNGGRSDFIRTRRRLSTKARRSFFPPMGKTIDALDQADNRSEAMRDYVEIAFPED